ncbi:dehydrogenase/reductase SDR family member 9-like [Saccostrea echinata]|uniref:dehydrogenase/reductase SDR family member 9-like n=1 Tax=Saccostrea echinata TaxID=191078 RepID=UPI002A80CF19|nr:dehydrogenase/reductase SDR family member 9-like [Saccostrea echinata]
MEIIVLLVAATALFALCKFIENYLRSILIKNEQNKCVLVTGCDTGFGHRLAQELDKRGIRVFAGCYTEDGRKRLMEKCSSNAVIFPLDVTKEDSIQNAVNLVKSELQQDEVLWGVVNNAGILHIAAPLEWQTRDHYDKTLSVNLIGAMMITKAFLPLLRESKGRLVNMSSVATMVSFPGVVAYNISKAALESYTDTFRREMYHVGVTAHLIQPTGFATNIFPQDANLRLRQAFSELPDNVKEFYGEKTVHSGGVGQVKSDGSFDSDLSKVTTAIQHALFARFPKYRYPVGRGSVALFWTLTHLPEIVADRMFSVAAPRH